MMWCAAACAVASQASHAVASGQAALRKLIETQNASLPKPLWPGLLEGAIRIDVPLNAPWTKDQEYVYWAN